MSTSTKTDIQDAIKTIAEANIMIQENDKTLEKQKSEIETNEARLKTLKENAEQLERDNALALEKGKDAADQKAKQNETAEKSIQDKRVQLEAERVQLEAERDALTVEREEAKKARIENDRIKEENTKIQADLESKNLERQKLSELRKGELANLEREKGSIIEERKKLEILQKSVESDKEENKKILARIEQAKKDAEARSESANETLALAQAEKNQAVYEQSAATYAKNEAQQLIQVFRQAIRTYTQVNGTSIQLEELTDEHRKIIAKDMVEQCEACEPGEIFPNLFPVSAPTGEENGEKGTEQEVVVGTTIEPNPLIEQTYENYTKAELVELAQEKYKLTLNKDDKHTELVEQIINHIKSTSTEE